MESSEVLYRPFRPGDGAGVVEVIREYYKDDYYHAACYDADYLEQANANGRRILFVAESPSDGIVGVAGGNDMAVFPGSYELGLHVFKTAYQGKGLGQGLLSYVVGEIGRSRIYGVYGMAISYHDRSQRECESIGLPATGFWLGRYRSDRSFFKQKPLSPKLHSIVVALPGMLRNEGPLYAPKEHRKRIAEIYESIKTPFAFAEDGESDRELSSYTVIDTQDARNREIYVRCVGRDIGEQTRALIRGGSAGDSYTVFLNMLDKGCELAYEALRDMGFYFTGIHPLHERCEYMMLHRECEGGYVWEETNLTPINGRLLQYILSHKER